MKFSKKTASNGLRSIVAPMDSTDTVTALVFIGTGANNEKKDNNGLSHFLEHMFFKGTKNYPKPGELSRMLDSVGAEHNAFTSREETAYWIKVGAEHFSLALRFVSDILQNALIQKEEIDKERGVILEEMRMYWDDPMRFLPDVFESMLYGDNPYGWDVIGTVKNIKNMKRPAFLKYWKSQYVAKNTVVVFAGKLNEAATHQKIHDAFSDLRTGEAKKEPKFTKVKPGPRTKIIAKDTNQTHIMIGNHACKLGDKNKVVVDLLTTILGGYMSSRLFEDIRNKHGLAYAVLARNRAYKNTGYFSAYAGVPHEKAKETSERLIDNFSKVKKSGVTAEELNRAKENFKGRLVISLESTDEVAGYLGEQELLLGKIRTPQDIIKRVEKVTKEDIKRAARRIFAPENTYAAIIGAGLKEDGIKKILSNI